MIDIPEGRFFPDHVSDLEASTIGRKFKTSESLGAKHDDGKLMYHLVPWWANWILARLLTYGVKKYAPDSWQHVPDGINRYTSALIGHLEAWRGGARFDAESGLPHLWHVFVNAMFLIYLDGSLPENPERTIPDDHPSVS